MEKHQVREGRAFRVDQSQYFNCIKPHSFIATSNVRAPPNDPVGVPLIFNRPKPACAATPELQRNLPESGQEAQFLAHIILLLPKLTE